MLTIDVQQNHLDDGKPRSSSRCPIALAIYDQVPGVANVEVGLSEVVIEFTNGSEHLYDLDDAGQYLVSDYDGDSRYFLQPCQVTLIEICNEN